MKEKWQNPTTTQEKSHEELVHLDSDNEGVWVGGGG